MKKTLLRTKGEFVHGVFIVKEIYASKKIAELNTGFKIGWNSIDGGGDCDANHPCAASTPDYYEECIGGKCVRFPIG